MAWVNISENTFKKTYNGHGDHSGYIHVKLQYDNASVSPTSVKLRFVLFGNAPDFWDMYYILLYPTDSSKRTLHVLKDVFTLYDPDLDAWPYYAKQTFTVTKSAGAAGFTIPAFWFICDGWDNTSPDTAAAFYNNYKDGGVRDDWRTAYGATTIAIASNSTVATAISKGTVSITDNGNNTFTLKGTRGAAGNNNPVKSSSLKWGYNTSYSNTFTNNSTKTLEITTPTAATRTVYAKSTTSPTYGSDAVAAVSLAVKQYVGPTKSGKPEITYKRSRLTIKDEWTISWGASAPTNSSSPVRGYRIRIFVNDTSIQIKNASGTVLSSDNGNTSDKWRHYYDSESTSTSMTFYVNKHDIKPKDVVKIVVHGYTKNAKGEKVFISDNYNTSEEYQVRHAGIMRTKISDGKKPWKEGQVYVKTDGKWKEAEVVYTKADGKWKEAD